MKISKKRKFIKQKRKSIKQKTEIQKPAKFKKNHENEQSNKQCRNIIKNYLLTILK